MVADFEASETEKGLEIKNRFLKSLAEFQGARSRVERLKEYEKQYSAAVAEEQKTAREPVNVPLSVEESQAARGSVVESRDERIKEELERATNYFKGLRDQLKERRK